MLTGHNNTVFVQRIFLTINQLKQKIVHFPCQTITNCTTAPTSRHWRSRNASCLDRMTARNPQTLMALPSEENFDFLFKIVLIGDCCTGKTSILQRFKTGNYVERHGNTIGVDFSMKTIEVEGKQVKVNCQCHTHTDWVERIWFVVATNLGYCRPGALSHHHPELLSCQQRRHNWWVVIMTRAPIVMARWR